MRSPDIAEHYVTLFDRHFLPQGLCLYRSLVRHASPMHLWILCIDEEVERALRSLNLPDVTLLPLSSVESGPLLAVKGARTLGEYCWTLTPFTADFVFARAPDIDRVTYLDADLFFFAPPAPILDEFDASGKHVLITEHAYAPEYEYYLPLVGRFCVQFMTFRNSRPAAEVSAWWQARCLEWCFARAEDGKFGDQKYLDDWPERFPAQVHVLQQKDKALAPWNARFFEASGQGRLAPAFFHFQGLRIHPGRKVTLYSGYRIGRAGRELYRRYLEDLKRAARELDARNIPIAYLAREAGMRARLVRAARLLKCVEERSTLN